MRQPLPERRRLQAQINIAADHARSFATDRRRSSQLRLPRALAPGGAAAGFLLVVHRKAGAAILRPALFGGLGAERLFFAVADHPDTAGRYALAYQHVLGRVGAVLAERQVVLVAAALVAVAADYDLDIRVGVQVAGVFGQRSLGVAADIRRVVIEEDVLHVGLELFFCAHGGGRRLHCGRRIDRHAGRGVGRAAVALGDEVIGRRLSRSHGLHARSGYVTDAVDRNRGSVGGMPGKLYLVACRDDCRRRRQLLRGSRRYRRGGRSLRGYGMLLLASRYGNHGKEQNDRDIQTLLQGNHSLWNFKFNPGIRPFSVTLASPGGGSVVAFVPVQKKRSTTG